MPERLESEVLHKMCYINTLNFTFTFTLALESFVTSTLLHYTGRGVTQHDPLSLPVLLLR